MGEVANAPEDKPDIKVGYQWSLAFSELNSKLYANLRNIAGIGQSRNSTKTGLVKFSRVFAREFVTRIDTLTACKRKAMQWEGRHSCTRLPFPLLPHSPYSRFLEIA